MQLSEWLHYIETISIHAVDFDLTRVKTVAERLQLIDPLRKQYSSRKQGNTQDEKRSLLGINEHRSPSVTMDSDTRRPSSADLLQWDCPIITVAGTNGKGSCVALSAAILQAAGYRVGSFFSPHLYAYSERICINGQAVQDLEITLAFEQIEKARQEVPLTYFEFGTLAALLIFKQAQLEVLVLEVGLGGRLDAVNIVDADVTIISSIDLDHMEYLGPTRAHIAREKAGIMRAGKPCVWGDSDRFDSITTYARDLNVPLYCQNQEFGWVEMEGNTWTWWNQSLQLLQLPRPRLYLGNAACVLQALFLLRTCLNIPQEAIIQGLKSVFLPGRFQVLHTVYTPAVNNTLSQEKQPPEPITHILDVAHNPASARLLARQMQTLDCLQNCAFCRISSSNSCLRCSRISNTLRFSPSILLELQQNPGFASSLLAASQGRCFAVVGMLMTKDIQHTLSPLIAYVDAWHVATLTVSKGAKAEQLAEALKQQGVLDVSTYANVKDAYTAVMHIVQPGDRILIFGSFHTIAEVMPFLPTKS